MKRVAFLFPGQGAQYPGMGKDFADAFAIARETFEEADDLLGEALSKVIFEGPESELTKTSNAQLAIFVTSVAILRTIQQQMPDLCPVVCAGLSLGEYTALFASGRLSFREALLLVRERARLMNEACEQVPGTMAAVLGMNGAEIDAALQGIYREGLKNRNMARSRPEFEPGFAGGEAAQLEQVERCSRVSNSAAGDDARTDFPITSGIKGVWVANYNCPGQIVISGTKEGIAAASMKLKEAGAKRIIPLQVHGAFHSGLMQGAQDALAPLIAAAPLVDSQIDLVMNVPGKVVSDLVAIRKNLTLQVTHSIRWEQGIRSMGSIDLYLEIGCGKVLTGFNRKIGVTARCVSIEKITDLEGILCNS